nr:MAG TPA: hypothetical protein [Caudoviricetes sp.]
MQVSHFCLKVSNNGIFKRFKAILSHIRIIYSNTK